MVEGGVHRRRHRKAHRTTHRRTTTRRRRVHRTGVKRRTHRVHKRTHRKVHKSTRRRVHRRRHVSKVSLKSKTLVQLKRLAKKKKIAVSHNGKTYKKSTLVRLLSR